MATSIRAASIARDVAELMKANRRTGGAIAASQVPLPAKDRLVIATSGQPATWQLSALPYLGDLGSSLNLSLNGVELDEATDYSVDYTTGLVTFSMAQQALFKATPSPADVLTADYLTSDDLIAAAMPAFTGLPPAFKNATTAGTTSFTSSLSVASPTCAAGDLLLLAFQVADGTVSGTPTGGWSLIATVNSGPTSPGDAEHYYVYTKTATSTDASGTTYAASAVTAGQQLTLACLSYTAGSVDVVATNGTASGGARVTSWACPTVTVTDARTLVEFFAERNGATGASFSGPGAPTTVRADVAANNAPSQFTLQRVIDEPMAAAGTSTARTVTSGLGGAWASITVALSP